MGVLVIIFTLLTTSFCSALPATQSSQAATAQQDIEKQDLYLKPDGLLRLLPLSELPSKAWVQAKMQEWLKTADLSHRLQKVTAAFAVLTHLHLKIPPDQIFKLVEDKAHEIKLQAFDYAYAIRDQLSDADIKALFRKSFHSSPYQLRLKVLKWYRELTPERQKDLRPVLEGCLADASDDVRKACP